jgi:UDP-N-acetylmuramoyl-tripeptide--D-alanyl-D-alanine ligase
MMRALSVTAAVLAWTLASTRWLRVAQREHYLPESVYRFTRRWWTLRPWNISLAALAIAARGLAFFKPSAVLLSSAVLACGPLGLGLRGRSGALHWTRRLKTLAAFHLAISVILCSLLSLWLSLAVSCSALAILVPLSLELALRLTAPLQRREMDRFVAQAKRKLDALGPRIVGITGSYGKTSTKQHLAHLISTSLETLASPASFNNRAGLARSINEQLSPSHQLFIAEMGTYGIGEIAELCSWCRPDVAVLTAIGPVHLERMGSMAAILDAKLEIAEMAPDWVKWLIACNALAKRSSPRRRHRPIKPRLLLMHRVLLPSYRCVASALNSLVPCLRAYERGILPVLSR